MSVSRARLLAPVFLVAAVLVLAANPGRADTGGRALRLGERLDRVSDRAEDGYRADVDLRAVHRAERLEIELPGGRFAEVGRARLEQRAAGDLLWTDVCLESLPPPKRLKAKAVSSSRVRLKWKDKSRNEDGFYVEMSTDGGRFERIVSTGANTKKLFVDDLESGTTYTFRVQAFNAGGVSPYSNQRSVTLP